MNGKTVIANGFAMTVFIYSICISQADGEKCMDYVLSAAMPRDLTVL